MTNRSNTKSTQPTAIGESIAPVLSLLQYLGPILVRFFFSLSLLVFCSLSWNGGGPGGMCRASYFALLFHTTTTPLPWSLSVDCYKRPRKKEKRIYDLLRHLVVRITQPPYTYKLLEGGRYRGRALGPFWVMLVVHLFFVSPGNTTAQLRCYSVVIATAEGAGAPYIALDSTQSPYCQPLSVHRAHGVCLLCPLLFIYIAACTLYAWEREKETWRFEVVCCTSNKPDIIELARILSFGH